MKYTIEEIKKENFRIAFPLIKELNESLSELMIKERFLECLEDNYRLLSWNESGKCVAIVGYRIDIKIFSGRSMYIDNFCVEKSLRSTGLGKAVIEHVEKIAYDRGCEKCILDTFTSNTRSHKFYYREGYEVWGFHFVKELI